MGFKEIIAEMLKDPKYPKSELKIVKDTIQSSRFASTNSYDELRSRKGSGEFSRGDASEALSNAVRNEEEKREALIALSFAHMFRYYGDDILNELLTISQEQAFVELDNLRKLKEISLSF